MYLSFSGKLPSKNANPFHFGIEWISSLTKYSIGLNLPFGGDISPTVCFFGGNTPFLSPLYGKAIFFLPCCWSKYFQKS